MVAIVKKPSVVGLVKKKRQLPPLAAISPIPDNIDRGIVSLIGSLSFEDTNHRGIFTFRDGTEIEIFYLRNMQHWIAKFGRAIAANDALVHVMGWLRTTKEGKVRILCFSVNLVHGDDRQYGDYIAVQGNSLAPVGGLSRLRVVPQVDKQKPFDVRFHGKLRGRGRYRVLLSVTKDAMLQLERLEVLEVSG